MKRKGIILAGGNGTRLHPLTAGICKQLLPVYDKPMIYYPLCTFMLAGIREILLISTPRDVPVFEHILGDGSQWGLSLSYCVQESPKGLAEAYILGEEFLAGHPSALVLGDNLFFGSGFTNLLDNANTQAEGATVFAYRVSNPSEYGVVGFDDSGNPTSIEEKPPHPKSNYAITGLYYFDNKAPEIAASIKPSARGELEITDIIRAYFSKDQLNVEMMSRGTAWLDTGTHDSLLEAAHFIQTLERRQGLRVGSPEEIAWASGWITKEELRQLAQPLLASGYGEYLLELVGG